MLGFLAGGDCHAMRQPVVDRQVDVEPDREVEIEALVAPALRRHRDAEPYGLSLRADVDWLALPEDFAARLGVAAEDAHGEFATAGADETIEADDFAPLDGQRNVLEALAGKAARFQQRLAERYRL